MPDVPVLAPAQGPAGAEAAAAGAKRRFPLLLILIGAGVLAAGLGAALFLTHASGRSSAAARAAAVHKPSGPPLYLALDPPFVVNFQADQMVRFLQVSVEVMSRDPQALEVLKSNDPVLRNDLLILLADQKYSVISTPAGKELLRAEALTAIRKDFALAGGDPNKLEAVYFTSFVMQ
ncbi:MAG TPA: flagellar basal body-associated FliL family protein [Steroidobacteraceae bacterium]|jgi:flagellar FliL protein|nr:flagellar basal body-associated FliL family protein [Steroidobacteraceae bacterium]